MRDTGSDILALAAAYARGFFRHSRSFRGSHPALGRGDTRSRLNLGGLLLLARNRLCRALAGAGIGVRALAANGQAAPVPQAAIAAKIHQAFDVHGHIAPQVALDHVVAVDDLADLQHFLVGELRDPSRLRNSHFGHDLIGLGGADAVDVLQRDHDALVGRNVDACDTGQGLFLLRDPGIEAGRLLRSNALALKMIQATPPALSTEVLATSLFAPTDAGY